MYNDYNAMRNRLKMVEDSSLKNIPAFVGIETCTPRRLKWIAAQATKLTETKKKKQILKNQQLKFRSQFN